MKFLIVEDEKHLNDLLYDYVRNRYPDSVIDQVFDGYDASVRIKEADYDLFLLDVMLPNIDGFQLVKLLRETSDAPVIMLSALSDEDNQLRGYDLGIDEFVPKPYSPKLLIKKIEAVLARSGGEDTGVKQFGIIAYDVTGHSVSVAEEAIRLNKKEWDLLMLFLHHPGRVFSREDLLNKVWGYDYFGDARTVDTHIKRLRKKLGEAATYIKTVFKEGYKLEA